MAKFRMPLLIIFLLGLVFLVWLDNQSDDPAPTVASNDSAQVTATRPSKPGKTAKDTGVANIVPRHNPLAALQRGQFHDTIARPLFSATRKQPPAPVQTKAQTSRRPLTVTGPAPDDYELLGVIYGDDKRAIALLRQIRSGRNFRVEQGDMVGGWQVIKVDAARVKLSRNGKTVNLPLSGK